MKKVYGDDMIYGLTGGIATGKSTVAEMLRELGAYIIDADQISRQVVEPDQLGAKRIREHFGKELFTVDGQLKRDKLAQIIFHNSSARKQLNHLLHPIIMKEMQRQTDKILKQEKDAVVIWDIPLLYEENLTNFVQKVIVIYVPQEVQCRRLQLRNNLNQEEAESRIQSQLSIEEKKSLADYLIDNSGTVQQTKRQVVALWNHLT
ncbi:dephospho-CoA kinase [Shimazuella sp. AN120528]|uniref:dephospho-CoA kinase n=1 Tax=Shimazuella soli TaxID=1892854 RepID=UPI001F0FC830|nr:dephospho-CoA kinase [Shimazuella soli]MCH5584382.1 dephospho-CoA kinase [Shimazuella soli]